MQVHYNLMNTVEKPRSVEDYIESYNKYLKHISDPVEYKVGDGTWGDDI